MFRELTDHDEPEFQPNHDAPDWQYNRMVLIGELAWVQGMIYELHRVGIAEVNSWSRITPTSKPGEMISTLLRSRRMR
jgi:hypothetical protein